MCFRVEDGHQVDGAGGPPLQQVQHEGRRLVLRRPHDGGPHSRTGALRWQVTLVVTILNTALTKTPCLLLMNAV